MRALFLLDPLERLKPRKDTSLDLMRIALTRGHQVEICEVEDVRSGSDGPIVSSRAVQAKGIVPETTEELLGAVEIASPSDQFLQEFDAAFIRIDPPFDIRYLSLCLLVEANESRPFWINSPVGLRKISEKLSTLLFARHTPRTLVSFRTEELRRFASSFPRVVLKPAFHGSGKGVVSSSADDPGFDTKVEAIRTLDPLAPIIAQQFLPEIEQGDVRVMLLEGEPVAALGRVPAEGDFRANIAAGGNEQTVELSDGQRAIAIEVGEMLRQWGIFFAGLDFIGDKLIEINVTSPTLIQELRRLGGVDVGEMIFDRLETLA